MNDASYPTELSARTSATKERAVTGSAVTTMPDAHLRNRRKTDPFAPTGETAYGASSMKPLSRSIQDSGRVDPGLLERAMDLLEDVEHLEPDDLALTMESLRNAVCKLWLSVSGATVYHQSILANIESFLLSHESVNAGQAAALRGAVKDLKLTAIGEQHAEVVRSQFIDQGQKPLAFLSDLGSQTNE